MKHCIQQAQKAHSSGCYHSITRAAAAFNVSCSTVTHQVASCLSRVEVALMRFKLYNIEEEVLVEWII